MTIARTRHPAAAFACALLVALTALLPQKAAAQLTGTLSGPRFVETAAIAGLFEIEAAKLALTRSRNDAVRRFAQQMVDDHTRIAADLKRAATAANGDISVPSALDAEHDALLQRLKAVPEREFDAQYVAMQKTAHEQAVGLFGAFARQGDQTALKEFAQQTLPMLQHHLEQVEKIAINT